MSASRVTEWWVEIRGEEGIIPEKLRIAERIGKEWGLHWAIKRDERDKAGVLRIRSNTVQVSWTRSEFENLRDKVGQRLTDSLASWVLIDVKCNDIELDMEFFTPGGDAVL